MATDGPTPPPCDDEIFQHGKPVAALDGRSNAVETWVQRVAAEAQARIDWHYSGGVAQVLHIGDNESRDRVIDTMRKLTPELNGCVLQYFREDSPGLYRKGVTPTPPNTVAAFFEGGAETTYIAEDASATVSPSSGEPGSGA